MHFLVTVLAETCGVLAAVHRCNVLLTHVTQGNLREKRREEIRVRKRKEEMEVRERKRREEKNEESERGGVYLFSFIFVGIILKLY